MDNHVRNHAKRHFSVLIHVFCGHAIMHNIVVYRAYSGPIFSQQPYIFTVLALYWALYFELIWLAGQQGSTNSLQTWLPSGQPTL